MGAILDLGCPSFRPSFHHNFVSAQNLENKLIVFHQILYICVHIDKIYVGIVTCHFSHNYTRVMDLDLHQNFVSAQYLENKLTEFYKILYMHSY